MNSLHNDIIIQEGTARYYFSYLAWDSHFFNRPSYLLNTDKSKLSGNDTIKEEIKDRLINCFVTAKIDTAYDYNVVKLLQDAGFYYIETEITLEYQQKLYSVAKQFKKRGDVLIEKLAVNDDLPYTELGSVFSLTRFHTDPCTSEMADDVWISYLKNYNPDKNHHLFVARIEGEIAGVILANQRENRVMLFFIAVKNKYRAQGIGTVLINYVVEYFYTYQIMTETQVRNIKAINYYIKNGFLKIFSTKTVLHKW
ncbi:MAG: GNAT family N-acetyltransferase [bacterium]